LTGEDKAFLLGILPAGAEDVSRSAEALINSSSDVLSAADRLKQKQSCTMDRELVGLGSAIQKAAAALQRLEPLLLDKQAVSVGDLAKPTPEASDAMVTNWRRSKGYHDALNDMARAAQMLQTLDPLGSSGPPEESSRLLKNVGQSLVGLEEKSGIGIYFSNAGVMLEWLAYSSARYDKGSCAEDARLLGRMIYLAGESMSSTTSVLWESASATALGTELQGAGLTLPLSFVGIDRVLDIYAKCLFEQADSLAKTADALRNLDAPTAFGGAFENLRRAAPMLDEQTTMIRTLKNQVDHARETLGGAHGLTDRSRLRKIVQAAGTELKNSSRFAFLTETGEALISAGDSLEKNQVENAQRTLVAVGQRVIREERPLLEERH
jgi:hypothetical protein